MVDVANGYGRIKHEGSQIDLVPSFVNIAQIGTPREIIEMMKMIRQFDEFPIGAFLAAKRILNACGVPDEYTGGLCFNEWKGYTSIQPGIMPVKDVIVLASHCVQHGICGEESLVDEAVNEKRSSTIQEFNAYEFVMSAIEFLGLSMSEAENLTMTKYIKLCKAKTASIKQRGSVESGSVEPSKKELDAAEADYERMLKERGLS